MTRRHPRATRTYTPFPYTQLFRSRSRPENPWVGPESGLPLDALAAMENDRIGKQAATKPPRVVASCRIHHHHAREAPTAMRRSSFSIFRPNRISPPLFPPFIFRSSTFRCSTHTRDRKSVGKENK